VQRLTGFDAQFIYDDGPQEPQHTLKLAVLSPEASARCSREAMKDWIRARLPALPPLRWRALRVPFDLHHPVWVDDPALDLDWHVRRLGLPAPGGRAELCEVVSELAGQPLDPSRPLWEMWLLEGYEGGRVVALLKLSHALADGAASRLLMERLWSDAVAATGRDAGAPAALPSRWRLLGGALRDLARDLGVELPKLLRAALRARRRVRAARARGELPEAARFSPLRTPPTPFAGALSRRRAFHFASLSLAGAREIRRAFGCTLNDVVLATAAGAVRRYLLDRGALPGLPTRGFMPASIRSEGELWGNRITTRFLELPTQLADPVARLRAIVRETKRAKAELRLREGAQLEDFERVLPPLLPKLIALLVRTLVRLRPDFPGGVTVSNVPGPAALRAFDGKVENLVSVGHMKFAAGLNVTVWSYADRLNFALYACARAVPDLWRVAEHVGASFEELLEAAAHEAAREAARAA
jgi:WS/DGAT/MGAT family acyltransferase